MMKKTLRPFAALACLSFASLALADIQQFVGTDGDWFNARNWSGGHMPYRFDSVIIPDGKRVVIDPPTGTATIVLENVLISSFGSLETKAGTQWITGNEFVLGSLIHRSTDASTDLSGMLLCADLGGPTPGTTLNPTPKTKRIIVLSSSMTMGLGGNVAAGPGKVGRGYYANLKAETAIVAGRLNVELMYGFVPRAGDRFRILQANQIQGRYAGLPEGALVKQVGNIGLYIHYTAREHILLARQVGL